MSKAQDKVVFVCQECGKESLKWLGRCPDCQQWNTFVEMTVRAEPALAVRAPAPTHAGPPRAVAKAAVAPARMHVGHVPNSSRRWVSIR